MSETAKLIPITGTFLSPLLGDTGINNWGLREWETEFKFMKALGIDTVIIIRCEVEYQGEHISALDPRSVTWKEDPDILSMFFRLAEKHDMRLFLGGSISLSNLYMGEWRKEVDANSAFYEKMLEKYSGYSCFQGLYVTLEALPWHFNFFDIVKGVLKEMKRLAPEKKTLLSPSFFPLNGTMSGQYSAEEFERVYGRELFDDLSGLLDYCAPQDGHSTPECVMGKIGANPLDEWYRMASGVMRRNNIELWANVETFQRPYVYLTDKSGYFRQCDYRSLYSKLQAASPYASKVITFEFSSCMSPNAEWGSSRRLLTRYLEMTGQNPSLVEEFYD